MTPGFGSEEMLVVNSKTEYTGKGLLVPNWLHLNAYLHKYIMLPILRAYFPSTSDQGNAHSIKTLFTNSILMRATWTMHHQLTLL